MLARHAPQGVTLRNYQDFDVFDLWAEIRKLPGLKKPEQDADAATGTYNVKPRRTLVPQLVPTYGISQLRVATSGTHAEMRSRNRSDVSGSDGSGLHQMPSGGKLGATGFEPATSCSQSRRATELRHAPMVDSVPYAGEVARSAPRALQRQVVLLPAFSRAGGDE